MNPSIFTAAESPILVARRYIEAYNAVDLDTLLAVLHPDKFQFSHHNYYAYAATAQEFVMMVGRMAKESFPGRQFTHIHAIHAIDDLVLLDTTWKGVPIVTVPKAMEKGVELITKIKSLIVVEDGLITEIRDHN